MMLRSCVSGVWKGVFVAFAAIVTLSCASVASAAEAATAPAPARAPASTPASLSPSAPSPSQSPPSTSRPAAAPSDSLKSAASFASIADRSARSVALFKEAARVIQHPRCLNCHPADRTPTQGDDLHSHVPNMRADAEGHGPAGMPCNTCHQAQNTATNVKPIETIPGHAHWMLAPVSMDWQAMNTAEICRQIKDPARNGGRDLQKIHDHMALDTLVGWAWNPGAGRKPAPGTQKSFGELIAAWIDTGAACPEA